MPTIIATVGAANANSYETQAEANTYFDERLPLPTPWVASGDAAIRALLTATRVLDAMALPHRTLRHMGQADFYYTSRQWTGTPASATQRLAWPRVGMFDANGNAIASTVIPQALKDAESELAGQLIMADTTLDNAVAVGGITSVKAGSVSVSFKENIDAHVLPDAVLNLMPPSWFTDDLVEPASSALFDVIL
jgi:hypothetical protein